MRKDKGRWQPATTAAFQAATAADEVRRRKLSRLFLLGVVASGFAACCPAAAGAGEGIGSWTVPGGMLYPDREPGRDAGCTDDRLGEPWCETGSPIGGLTM